MQEPISRRSILGLAGAGAALAAALLLGGCRDDAGGQGGEDVGGQGDDEGGMGSGSRGKRRH
jgi:hypothetical protein